MNFAPLRLIRFLLRAARHIPFAGGLLTLSLITSLVAGGASAALVGFINEIVNGAVALSRNTLLAFGGLCLLLPMARLVSEAVLIRLTGRAVFGLRLALARQILAAPLKTLEEKGSPKLLAALTQDITSVSNAVTQLPQLTMQLAVLAGCLGYLVWLSPMMFLVFAGVLVVGVLTYQLPLNRALGHLFRARQRWDELFEHFKALTDGIKELKLNRRRRQAFFDDQLEATAESLYRTGVRGGTIYAAAASWGQLLLFVTIGGVLVLGYLVWNVEVRVLTGFSLMILYMMTPLEVVLNIFPTFGQAAVSAQAVERLGLGLDAEARGDEQPTELAPAGSWRELTLEGVRHTYHREGEDSSFTLGPLDLTVQRGELLFLVGGNGSGKTTLMKLLVGLYEPEAGRILLDGEEISEQDREAYRQLFSAIFFDFYLFQALLGVVPDGLEQRVEEFLRKLHLSHKVQLREGALTTTELSQGQRKRLALMTAYLENRPIYVFDEWAADQDPSFKEIFYRQLLPELKAAGHTAVVISHDSRYFELADRIVRLEEGQLVAELEPSSAEDEAASVLWPVG